jgi:hypothetical protein
MEYGENIGTVKTLFRDVKNALGFAKRIMQWSGHVYQSIDKYQWYCSETREFVKIVMV